MPSFDLVSEVDLQEVRNAVDQASREIVTRYDFKDTGTSVRLAEGNQIVLESSGEGRLEAADQVLREKLVRRRVSLKALGGGEVRPAPGGRFRSTYALNQGIAQEQAKELGRLIRDTGLKVQVQVQGDRLRVSGKNRDDLQKVITALKELDYKVPLQFTNYRD